MAAYSKPGSPPISILCSLKNRHLLEQSHFCRYEKHPLIHAFANEIGRKRYPQLIGQANKKACVRFMTRFGDNANAYLRKDVCEESIESFNEDRHNFEYFLQKICKGMAKTRSLNHGPLQNISSQFLPEVHVCRNACSSEVLHFDSGRVVGDV